MHVNVAYSWDDFISSEKDTLKSFRGIPSELVPNNDIYGVYNRAAWRYDPSSEKKTLAKKNQKKQNETSKFTHIGKFCV
jgi:hypothetical protein